MYFMQINIIRYFTLFFLLFFNLVFSQTISKQIIGPVGSTYENGNNKLTFTAGEVVVGAMTDEDGTFQLGNGYYPSLDLTPLSIEIFDLELKIKVFPNPAKEIIYVSHPTEQIFDVKIIDFSGKKIINKIYQKHQPIDIQNLNRGAYFVIVKTKDLKQNNTYKFIKK